MRQRKSKKNFAFVLVVWQFNIWAMRNALRKITKKKLGEFDAKVGASPRGRVIKKLVVTKLGSH